VVILRRHAVGVAIAGVVLSMASAPACGSPDCTETLTCADQPTDDASGFDQALGDRNATDQSSGGDRAMDARTSEGSPDAVLPPPDAGCDAGAVENCVNGIDDNCNGLVDCADPMCSGAGFACVPAAPPGWTGPGAYYTGASIAPPCPGGYPTDSLDGESDVQNSPAMCACACGAVQGAGCSTAGISYYQDAMCNGASCGMDALPPNFCVAAPCAAAAVIASPPIVQGGVCTPAAKTTIPQVSWSKAQRACTGPVGGGCSSGMVCAPPVASPFAGTRCVYSAGAQACPGDYPNASTTTYGGVSDTRSCSACACGAPTGLSCTQPTLTMWSGTVCMMLQLQSIPADGLCHQLVNGGMNNTQSAEASSFSLQGNGSCAASGGTAQGSLTPTQPSTVCCL
jgi:hypothetical protein